MLLRCLVLLLVMGSAVADEAYQTVEVADAYVELRTGPGRGFPVFHVVERGQWVEILKRKTDWFKVRSAKGHEGWVDRGQRERTLTATGVRKSFRDILVADYLERKLEVGFSGGQFDADPVMAVRIGYRPQTNFLGEFSLSQVSGEFSSTRLYSLNLMGMPFPDRRFSPYVTIGAGWFENEPRGTLVDPERTEAVATNAGLGLRTYITRRFIVSLDYRQYVVLVEDERSDEYHEWMVGLSVFF